MHATGCVRKLDPVLEGSLERSVRRYFSQLYGFISRPDCAAVHYVWMRVHMFPAFSLLLLCVSPMRFDSSRSVLLLTPRKGGSIPALLSQQSLARSAGKCSFTCYFF